MGERWLRIGATGVTIAVLLCLVFVPTTLFAGGEGEREEMRLVLWHQEQPPRRVQRFEEVIADFNAMYEGITVDVQVGGWDVAYQRVSAAALAGQAPDLMFVIPDFAMTVKELGVAAPVTQLVEELHNEHRFVAAAIDPYFADGEYWAVPLFGMQQVLWYRRDLFREAGIEAAPTTWDELIAAAERLSEYGRYGIAVPAGRNLASDQVIYSLMVTSGAQNLFDDACNVTFDTPETVRALALYQRLVELSPADATSYAWGEPQALFNAGEAAMAIEKGQYLGPFTSESGRSAADLGMARLPLPGTGGREGAIYYSNAVMVLTDDPARREAASQLIHFILSTEQYGRFLTAEPGLFLPTTMSGLDSQSFWDDPIIAQYREYIEEMVAYSDHGELFGFTGGNVCPAVTAISQQNLLAQTVQQMVVLGLTPREAAAWGQRQMEAAVRDSQ
ncbi:MAG: sugar ABC transporter substrate-binding protein [Spirochaetales bacterium]|nr:sugar ABC transporter substrate-binding protein [Spirochaetales bacterium]